MKDLSDYKNTEKLMSSGLIFDFKNPSHNQISIEDIALGLSREVRWGGQNRYEISVAEHCLQMEALCTNTGDKICAMLHDASEAYTRDIPKPLKNLIPKISKIEDGITIAIFKHFEVRELLNVNEKGEVEFPDTIKKLDYELLKNEYYFFDKTTSYRVPMDKNVAMNNYYKRLNDLLKEYH